MGALSQFIERLRSELAATTLPEYLKSHADELIAAAEEATGFDVASIVALIQAILNVIAAIQVWRNPAALSA